MEYFGPKLGQHLGKWEVHPVEIYDEFLPSRGGGGGRALNRLAVNEKDKMLS